jgi:sec-independent protein translocase protein TatC
VTAAVAKVRPEPPDELAPRGEKTMALLDHLEEFRVRLIRAALAVAAGMVVAFFFIGRIFDFVFEPTRRVLPPGTTLIYTQPGEGFSLNITLALYAGALLAAPFVFLQVWLFVAPALHARERKFVVPFLLFTTTGSLAGAAFSHYILFPYLMLFFASFNTPDLAFMPRVSDVFGLYLKMTFGMVVVFQMPTFAFFLAKLGLVTAGWLWRNIRYAILLIFIASAVLTPSADPWNQTIFAAPMIVLYIISIGIAWAFGPKRAATTA